jgi:hypothetical protein
VRRLIGHRQNERTEARLAVLRAPDEHGAAAEEAGDEQRLRVRIESCASPLLCCRGPEVVRTPRVFGQHRLPRRAGFGVLRLGIPPRDLSVDLPEGVVSKLLELKLKVSTADPRSNADLGV